MQYELLTLEHAVWVGCVVTWALHYVKGLSTREAGRGHATPHMPVETAKCCWLLKIEPNAWAGGCAVCVDLQAVGALEFFIA